MSDLLITERAKREYEDIYEWYSFKGDEVAAGFENAFTKGLQAISTQPMSFIRCDPIHRVYLMDRFPYKVIYRIFEDRITVVSVFHTSREPNTWKDR